MKTKLFSLMFVIVASIGTICAWDYENVQIGDLRYNLNETELTAEVTGGGNYSSSIVIPENITYEEKTYSVTSIKGWAFSDHRSLTSVTIPNSVISIGDDAFFGCSSLPVIGDIRYADTYLIEAVDKTLSSYNIKEGTRFIRGEAFSGCSNLTSITIPSSVISIGGGAFKNCNSLTSVVWNAKKCNDFSSSSSTPFTSAVTSFTFGDEVEYIPAYLCYQMSNLASVSIPNSVTSIGNVAFYKCSRLTSVTIPNSVTSIGNQAFYDCYRLTSVDIPNSITSIGGSAFYNCSSLTSVTISNSTTDIGENAFRNCSSLTSIIAPASALDISEQYWAGSTHSLQSATFTSGELTYNVLGVLARSYKTLTTLDISGVSNAELDDEAFKGFYNLQSLVLPANLTKVGYMSVAECVKLQSIDIPASVTEIDDRAFENCRSLKSITFGGSANSAPGRYNTPLASTSQLERIGNWAFYNCHELQNLVIPEGVKEIGDGAFYGCVYLGGLTLPASVRAIGDNSFALCAKLEKIVVNAPVPPTIQAKTFYDVQRQIPVYVPDDCISAYKDDALWGEFNIQGISNLPSSIVHTSVEPMPHKVLRNGQLLIQRGNNTYTVQGQEVR